MNRIRDNGFHNTTNNICLNHQHNGSSHQWCHLWIHEKCSSLRPCLHHNTLLLNETLMNREPVKMSIETPISNKGIHQGNNKYNHL